LEQVAPVEPGGLRREPGRAEQVLGEPVDRRDGRRPVPAEDGSDQPAGVVPGRPGPGGPPFPQRRLGLGRGFGGPGRQARRLRGVGPGVPGLGHRFEDLPAPRGERGEQVGGEAGDLGDALDRGGPGDPETLGELPAQHRVVEVRGGQGVAVDGLGVDGGPLPVRAVEQVRDDEVGVQLRVPGAGGAVLEGGDDPPVGGDVVGALPVALVPAQPVSRHRLQVAQRLTDGGPVRIPHRGRHLRVAEPVQDAD